MPAAPSPPSPELVENYHSKTASERHISPNLVLWDETLRDGEQMPGVHFTLEEKLRIAEVLSDIGVPVLNAGIPVVSPEEARIVSAVAHAGFKAKILAAGRTVPGDVEAVINSGATHIAIFVAASNVHLLYKLRMTQDEVLNASVASVKRAHEAGLHVAFVTEDTVRAPLDFVERLYKATIAAGADRLVVSDTVGIMTPLTFRWFLREFHRRVQPKDWSVHCHNDLGLAVANTVTAVEEGVTAPHTCVNGLGERAGNAAFEEVVMTLERLYGVKTGIKLERLYELSQLVEELSGVPLAANKALVGYNSFAHEAGIHSHGVLRNTLTYEPMQPEVIGRHRLFVLGKHTGKAALVEKLKERGAEASDAQVSDLLERIKTRAEGREKGVERELLTHYRAHFVNPGIHDEEFWEMVEEMGIALKGPSPTATPAASPPAAKPARTSPSRKRSA
jgi:isopropylmalate/homocitrate/citramalate synthase